MKNKYQINLKYSQNDNYSPHDCMVRYAKENNLKYGHTSYFSTYIRIKKICYVYDYWTIDKHSDGTETVTIFLKEAERF